MDTEFNPQGKLKKLYKKTNNNPYFRISKILTVLIISFLKTEKKPPVRESISYFSQIKEKLVFLKSKKASHLTNKREFVENYPS